MSRGNRRLALFKDAADYLLFLESVMRVKKKYPFKIHALCLMTNHFHMAIETEQVELWKIMSKFLHPYAMNFNKKYNYTGHLFEKRWCLSPLKQQYYGQGLKRPGRSSRSALEILLRSAVTPR